jgi:acetone carboxylase alpha subunit
MCGGYPAPTCQMHRAVRDTNIGELIEARKPLPHTIGTDPLRSDLEKLVDGEHVTDEGPYITAPHKSGDIFTHSYNGGGGYGDVLERDPVKTACDVENGFLTPEAAKGVFGIVLREAAEADRLEPDIEATAALRRQMRADRIAASMPVSAWIAQEAKRVAASDFAPEVGKMHANAMKLSPRFASEFRKFWGLEDTFTVKY